MTDWMCWVIGLLVAIVLELAVLIYGMINAEMEEYYDEGSGSLRG